MDYGENKFEKADYNSRSNPTTKDRESLICDLIDTKERLEKELDESSWKEFNLSKERALKILRDKEDKLSVTDCSDYYRWSSDW